MRCRELLGSRAPRCRFSPGHLAGGGVGRRRDSPTHGRAREGSTDARTAEPMAEEVIPDAGWRARTCFVRTRARSEMQRTPGGKSGCNKPDTMCPADERLPSFGSTRREAGDERCLRTSLAVLFGARTTRSLERVGRGVSRRGGERPRGRNERGRWSLPAEAELPSGGTAGVDSTSERPWRGTREGERVWSDPEECEYVRACLVQHGEARHDGTRCVGGECRTRQRAQRSLGDGPLSRR